MRFTADELAERMRAEPGAFSPNVFLRPVVESAVFPTLAYVGGPAETAYFAQIGPLFQAFGILPPIAYPRFTARLVPDEVAGKAAGWGSPTRSCGCRSTSWRRCWPDGGCRRRSATGCTPSGRRWWRSSAG